MAALNLRHVKIFSDSRSALQAIGNPFIKSRTVEKAIESLNKLTDKCVSVTLCWIPAHKGHRGNCRADDLAKEGAGRAGQDSDPHVHMPHSQIKSDIHKAILQLWTAEWQSDTSAAHTKFFYNGPSTHKAKHVYKLARLELGRFVRLITGHNNLNHFQTRIGLWGSPTCRLCGQDNESFIHLLTACPRLRLTRQDIFLDRIPCNDMHWSARSLLDFSFIPTINQAFEGTWAHGDPLDLPNSDQETETATSHNSTP